jgi:hypothetical protein
MHHPPWRHLVKNISRWIKSTGSNWPPSPHRFVISLLFIRSFEYSISCTVSFRTIKISSAEVALVMGWSQVSYPWLRELRHSMTLWRTNAVYLGRFATWLPVSLWRTTHPKRLRYFLTTNPTSGGSAELKFTIKAWVARANQVKEIHAAIFQNVAPPKSTFVRSGTSRSSGRLIRKYVSSRW